LQKSILKETNSFLSSSTLLAFIVLTIHGCEDKKQQSNPIPIENTTEIFTQKYKKTQHKKPQNSESQKNIQTTTYEKKSTIDYSLPNTYLLKTATQTQTLTLLDKKFSFQSIAKPIIIMTLYKSTCKSCRSQTKLLDKLSKKYQNNLFVMHLSEEMQDTKFIHAIHDIININTESPLILIIKEGEIYSHFEGLTPIEMILYDVQQAIKK
jgi:thiol-disulfide isomerase/thioredoxin